MQKRKVRLVRRSRSRHDGALETLQASHLLHAVVLQNDSWHQLDGINPRDLRLRPDSVKWRALKAAAEPLTAQERDDLTRFVQIQTLWLKILQRGGSHLNIVRQALEYVELDRRISRSFKARFDEPQRAEHQAQATGGAKSTRRKAIVRLREDSPDASEIEVLRADFDKRRAADPGRYVSDKEIRRRMADARGTSEPTIRRRMAGGQRNRVKK